MLRRLKLIHFGGRVIFLGSILNAYFFIVPAATSATEIAVRSLAHGRLLPEYKAAYMKEEIFGAVNVLFTVAAAVIGVWRFGGRALP